MQPPTRLRDKRKSDLLETSSRLKACASKSTGKQKTASMGISQSKFVKYDTPVYYQMKKTLWSEMYARY